uniref:Uncharacterized protein n=1 Tax=Photinus pyralis TaxID=7054 RepID=A0A1Y1MRV2_PHOPY
MKGIFYVLSFFLPLLVADPVKDEDVCLNKLYLDKDVMKPLLEQVIHPVEESVDYNAFLECFWKRIGYMDERGDLYWDDIRVDYEAKFGKSDQLMRVVVHCKKTTPTGQ